VLWLNHWTKEKKVAANPEKIRNPLQLQQNQPGMNPE
jgi:hypothetical protein